MKTTGSAELVSMARLSDDILEVLRPAQRAGAGMPCDRYDQPQLLSVEQKAHEECDADHHVCQGVKFVLQWQQTDIHNCFNEQSVCSTLKALGAPHMSGTKCFESGAGRLLE